MAEASTLARPYAQAVFDLAKQKSQLGQWSKTLRSLATLMSHPEVRAVIVNPNVARDDAVEILCSMTGDKLSEQARNFIKLLAQNHRLELLPEMAAQYELLKAAAENTLEADMISAFAVNDAQKRKIEQGLKKRLGRDVKLNCSVDSSLIGGAIIRAGDLVIDGSMQSRLDGLAVQLRA